jgi:hypothetical protein
VTVQSAPGAALVRAVALFAAAQGAVFVLVLLGLLLVFRAPGDSRAVLIAAGVAFVVQLLTFAVVRLAGRDQVIAAWGLGVLVRFAVVALWVMVLVPALQLAAGAATLALVALLFVSTLVEPLFLNR